MFVSWLQKLVHSNRWWFGLRFYQPQTIVNWGFRGISAKSVFGQISVAPNKRTITPHLIRFVAIASVLSSLVFLASIQTQAQQSPDLKRVVALYPYQKDAPISVAFDQTFQQEFQKFGKESIEYYSEYLEPYRFPDEAHDTLVRDYLVKKYAGLKIDVVVAVTDKALEFLIRYRNELFTNVPIVYFADRLSLALADSADITGVINADVIRRTAKAALDIDPSRKKVLIVVGSSGSGKTLELITREQLRELEGQAEFIYLADLPLQEVLRQTSSAPNDSFVLYIRQTTDENGKNLTPREGLARIVPTANVPIYGVTDAWIGDGIVGGDVFIAKQIANQVSEVVLRIAHGTKPQDIPLTQAQSTPMFDYRQIQRWNIPESRLPAGSVVRFKEPSFWQQYKWRLIAILAITVAEAILIVILLWERRRRILAHKALLQSEENLERSQAVSQVMTTHIGLDGRWLRVPATLCALLRYSEEQLLRSRVADITNLQDFQITKDKFEQLVSGNIDSFNLEQRVFDKSGKTIWILLAASLVTDKDKKPLHFLAYIKDVTHRKISEEQLRESEERFVKAFEGNPQPMALAGLYDDRYIDVNPGFLSMSGYERDEVVAHTASALGFWLDRSEWLQLTKELKQFREVRNHELRFRTKSGECRVLLASAELLDLRGRQCLLISATDITERKKLEQELAQLTTKLLNIQDEERRRIARDLHDGTAQNLFGISINLANLQVNFSADSHEVRVLTDCQALADETLREIRTLSYLLHPPLLDQTGLVSALQWYVEGFTKRSGIQVSIVAQPIGRLSSEIETALFRIVQESLTNVRKHSGSDTVVIRLEKRSEQILLEIRDNGNGFKMDLQDPATSEFAPGVGVPGMKQRLRQLGGKLEISSNSNGTKITAFVPLTNGAKNGSYSTGRRS